MLFLPKICKKKSLSFFFVVCFSVYAEPQPIFQRLTLSHVEGINAYSGYGTNYTSATAFLSPNYNPGRVLPFLDARVHHFDNNTYGGNVGIGARYIPKKCSCHILGLNFYYDTRRGDNWNYNQLGIGGEILGKRLDFRTNFYIPLKTTKYSQACVYTYPGDWFAIHYKCESVSWAFDAEVGYMLLRGSSFLFYMAGGYYYFEKGCLSQREGFELRLRPQYKDFFAVDFKLTYDNVYHTVFQTTFIVSLPLYSIVNKNQGPCHLSDREIYQPVIRQEAIPISRRSCWDRNF